jgi:Alcohol dehydrogenase, class IV
MGLAIPAFFAEETVLIPALLATLPYDVFAASSIDALIHAVESYISPKTNLFVRANGRTAIELILAGYQALAAKGARTLPDDMTDFFYASTTAGIAFGNAGCAAVHALSYPIGGNYHVPHGKANYMIFEQVFVKYRQLGADLSPLEDVICKVLDCPLDKVWAELFVLLDKILGRPPLRDFAVNEAKCAEMAASVGANQQRLLANNPIFLSEQDIYEGATCSTTSL